jgi:hypothetical protein
MRNQFNFDLHFQRAYVRGKDRGWKSLLIHTFLINGYVPNLLVWKNGDHLGESKPGKFKWVYYSVDCKQRVTTLFHYFDDQFRLAEDTPLVDGENVAGKLFSELSEDMQQRLKSYNFAVTIFDEEYTLEDVEEIFYRVNQTKPLTDYEQSRALLGETNLTILSEITQFGFFNKINFTSADLMGKVNEKIVFQIMALMTNRKMSFSGKDIKSFIAEIGKNVIPGHIIEEIRDNCEYLEEAIEDWKVKHCKDGLKKSVIPSLFLAVSFARTSGMKSSDFGVWAKRFLVDEYSKDSEFGQTIQSKTSNQEVIQKRSTLMMEDLREHLGVAI